MYWILRLLFFTGTVLMALLPGGAQELGLYADPNCTLCSLEIPPGETRTVYVSGPVGDLPDPGDFAGAEFRIVGVPAGWQYQMAPSPGTVLLGDPLSAIGARMYFTERPTGFCHPILTFALTATTIEEDVVLSFDIRLPPTYPCPLIALTYPPETVYLCFDGRPLFINSDAPCNVSVTISTWAEVKQLFR